MFTYKGKPIAKKRFSLFGKTVVVQLINTVNKSQGGIMLPDNARHQGGSVAPSPVCVVIAVGPEVKAVKEGDLIIGLFRDIVEKLFFDGDEMLVLQEGQIVGVLDEEMTEKYRRLAERPPEGAAPTLIDQLKGKRMAETK